MIDTDLLSELQLTLIEPPDGGATWPSGIWTRAEVLEGVNGGIHTLVNDVHLTLARIEINVAALTTTILLPSDWLATSSLVWRDQATSVRTPLGPAGSFESDLALPGWEATPGSPLAYADLDQASLTIRLCPTPAAPGVVELIYVQQQPEVTGNGTPLPIAEEFVSAIKYTALGYLLRKVGRLLDAERSEYCDRRYELQRAAAEIILGGWA